MNKFVASAAAVVIAVGAWLVWRKPSVTDEGVSKASAVAPELANKAAASGGDSVLWHERGGGNQIWRITHGSVQSQSLWSVQLPWQPVAYVAHGWKGDDLAVWQSSDREVRLWRVVAGNLQPSAKLLPPASAEWRIAALADTNADGYADVVWLAEDGRVAVWLVVDGEVIERAVAGSVEKGWQLVATADFNGDGKQDLLWRNAEFVVFWFMDGAKLQASDTSPSGGEQWSFIAAGRFKGDTSADLLWEDKEGRLVIWRSGNPGATFRVSRPVPAGWSLAQAADLDGNGYTDLIWQEADSGHAGAWLFSQGGDISDLAVPSTAEGWSVVRDVAAVRNTQ